MNWYLADEEDEEEDLMFSPALLARRASESWIVAPPVEVNWLQIISIPFSYKPLSSYLLKIIANSWTNNQSVDKSSIDIHKATLINPRTV